MMIDSNDFAGHVKCFWIHDDKEHCSYIHRRSNEVDWHKPVPKMMICFLHLPFTYMYLDTSVEIFSMKIVKLLQWIYFFYVKLLFPSSYSSDYWIECNSMLKRMMNWPPWLNVKWNENFISLNRLYRALCIHYTSNWLKLTQHTQIDVSLSRVLPM